MVEMGRMRSSVLVTFPVAVMKYPDQNLQEGWVSSVSQCEGAAHMSGKAWWQEVEKDGHIVSASQEADGR